MQAPSSRSLWESERGLQLSSVEWLLDHHKATESERRQMVAGLELRPGDRVLDLACGPGLWTSLLAEQVGHNGLVIGIDFSPDLIEYANKYVKKQPCGNIVELCEGDFYTIPFEDETFDVVFFANAFAHVTDAHRVIEEQKRVTKKGGRLAAKDFDGASVIFHPIEPCLSLKVMSATARALQESPPHPPFDNFPGRKLHGLFRRAGLKNILTRSYAIQKVSPLNPETKRYIAGNAEWYARAGVPYLSQEELRHWRGHFDETSDDYILDREEFYFCMIEVLTIGTV